MNDVEPLSFKVCCPADGKTRIMDVRIARLPNGEYFTTPCQGCDYACNQPACNQCIDRIFKMLQKDPKLQSYTQPIIPVDVD